MYKHYSKIPKIISVKRVIIYIVIYHLEIYYSKFYQLILLIHSSYCNN